MVRDLIFYVYEKHLLEEIILLNEPQYLEKLVIDSRLRDNMSSQKKEVNPHTMVIELSLD